MKRLGLIVNPVAGIGGKVGLKGSDGVDMLQKALALGAEPESGKKALVAMELLRETEEPLTVYACPGEMGEAVCWEAGLACTTLGNIHAGRTRPEDTISAAKDLRDLGVDLILFAGGDGTARNIMDAVGTSIPVLGIPAGCKIHSGVYALNPRMAGVLAADYLRGRVWGTREAEVMDIDEELFRQGIVQARLYGYLQIPNESKRVQNLKSGQAYAEGASIASLARCIADHWEDETLYIVGTGSTPAAIMKELGLPNTLLGVDLVCGRNVVATDCTESEILQTMYSHSRVKIVVTVIGGQGYLFGRGNQQISAGVIRRVGKENIIVAASKDKMFSLMGRPLHVDTGDEEVNGLLSGYIKVVVGYDEFVMARVEG